MSDAEIITILISFHFNSYRNFKHYYLFYVKEQSAIAAYCFFDKKPAINMDFEVGDPMLPALF